MTHEHILNLLLQFKYAILFPLVIIEGPIAAILSGFLSSLHQMNIFIAAVTVIAADLTSDTMYYSIGRWGTGKYLAKPSERVQKAEKIFRENRIAAIILGKLSHGLGWPVMMIGGNLRMKYLEFISLNFIGSIIKTAVFLFLGYYYGKSYASWSHSLNRSAIVLLLVPILMFGLILFFKYRSKTD